MKKLLTVLGILLAGTSLWANIDVTPGAGKTVATTTDGGLEYQNVVVSTTQIVVEGGVLAPIGYATSSSSYMPVAIKAGSIANTSFAVSTGGVTAAQGPAGTQDWSVKMTSTVVKTGTQYLSVELSTGVQVNGTVTANISGSINNTSFAISTGGVTAAQGTTPWIVQMTTGGVTSAQGPPGTADWPVRISTTNISVVFATVTIQAPNNNTTAIPVSGSLSTTPGALSIIGVDASTISVGYQTGTSSVPVAPAPGATFPISGSISNTSFAISTGGVTASQGSAGTADWSVKLTSTVVKTSGGGTNLGVDLSTGVKVTAISTGGVSASMMVNSPAGAATAVAWSSTISSVPVSVLGTVPISGSISNTSFAISTGGVTAAQGPAGTADWSVKMTTVALQTGGNAVGTMTVVGAGATGQNVTGIPVYEAGYTSSTTWPTQRANATVGPLTVDSLGRTVISGGVPEPFVSYATATLTNTSTIVIIASATTGLSARNYLCGITISNTSATATYVTVNPNGAPTATAQTQSIYVPAGMVTGYRRNCAEPIMKSDFASAISVTPAASVSSLLISSSYYLGP